MADKKISQLTGASTPLTGSEVLPIVQSASTVKVSVSNLTAGRQIAASGMVTTSDVFIGASSPAYAERLRVSGNYMVLENGTYTGFIGAGNSIGVGGTTDLSFRSQDGMAFGVGGTTLALQFSSAANVTFNTGNLVQGTAAKGVNFTANTPAAGMTSQLLNWYEEGTWTPSITFGNASVGVSYDFQTGLYTRIGNMVMLTCYIDLSNKGSSTGAARIAGLPFTVANNNGAYSAGSLWFDAITYSGVVNCYANINATTVDILQTTEAGASSALTNTNFADTSRIMFSIMYRAA